MPCHIGRMGPARLRTATLVIAAALIGLGVGLATGIFENGDSAPQNATTGAGPEATAEPSGSEGRVAGDAEHEPDLPRTEDDPEGLAPGPSGPAPASDDEVAAAAAARRYVDAIDERNGHAVCAAFAQDGLDPIELPAVRSSCPASLEASLGFRAKRGRPIWESSEMTQDVSAQVDGDSARVVATVFTEYADVREPTIEDDIIYLSRKGDGWLVVKPSATLYRAVGIADIPLEALEPPE